MAETTDSGELVFSYSVQANGKIAGEDHQRLQDALKRGAKVVDIISTPGAVGGQGAFGPVVVTVLLTFGDHNTTLYPLSHRSAK